GNRDVIADEETGEEINDAVYRRNSIVEDKYNVRITAVQLELHQIQGSLRNSVLSSDFAYDLVMPNFEIGLSSAQAGLVADMAQSAPLDLSNPWWNRRMINETGYQGKVFYAIGDVGIMANDATWILMFNKSLHRDLGLENIYQMVRDGEWTMDKFSEMSRDVSRDLNGDGLMDENDMYGIATSDWTAFALLYGSDIKITEKDAAGVPQLSVNTLRTPAILEKIITVMARGNDVAFDFHDSRWAGRATLPHIMAQEIFEDGRALFYGEVMQCVIRLRAMETEFGVIPFPKFDEYQERHAHVILGNPASVVAIPSVVRDAEMSAVILEELAYQSMLYLTPAYYETALEGKFLRDDDSSEMLDIILANRVCDIGFIGNVGNLATDFINLATGGRNEFASTFERRADAAQKALDRIIGNLAEQ
ncbi:MAG: hypothetical protein FWH10_06120, partial [Oscillospiraceae bacterium]|nr:hypothetical protein [Oscillospiraceae bacterium]